MKIPNKHSDLQFLRNVLVEFTKERDWEKFHTPKNLATALTVEAAELLEPFQWLKSGLADELSDSQKAAVRFEMADVLAYLILLADKLGIDLGEALIEKNELNAAKYPADVVRGDSRKYSEYKK